MYLQEMDRFWLAGLLEGEGSFLKGPPCKPNLPRISLQMTDQDITEKAASLLGVSSVKGCKPKKEHHKQCYAVVVRGAKAVEIMKELFPLMGERRKKQITAAIESHKPQINFFTLEQVISIRERAKQGEKHTAIAKEFGVHRSTISHMISGRNYGL
jgi:hypothetical protein